MVCCAFVLLSSLPRFLTILDFVITLLIYAFAFAARSAPSLSLWEFIRREFTDYHFREGGINLVLLAFVRMVILFYCFAYRFHRRAFAVFTSICVVAFSTLWVSMQFGLNRNDHLWGLLVWSLLIPFVELSVFFALRQQRVRRPDYLPTHEHTHDNMAQTTAVPVGGMSRSNGYALANVDQGAVHAITVLSDDASRMSYQRESPIDGSALLSPPPHHQTSAQDIAPTSSSSSYGRTSSRGRGAGRYASAQSYQRLDDQESKATLHAFSVGSRGLPIASQPSSPYPQPIPSALSGSYTSGPIGVGSHGSSSNLFAASSPKVEVDARSLADADSLFIEIDSLMVHYKMCVGGKPILPGKEPYKQRAKGTYSGNASAPGSRSSSVPSSPTKNVIRHSSETTFSGDTDVRTLDAAADPDTSAHDAFAADPTLPTSSSTSSSSSSSSPTFRSTLILLHGFGSSLFEWSAIWPDLCATVDTVLAFDRPGFGLTSRPVRDSSGSFGTFVQKGDEQSGSRDRGGGNVLCEQQNPYTPDYQLSLLFKLVQKLGLTSSRCILVGHSTGGALALRACLHSPTLFTSAVLISPHIYTHGFPELVKSLFKTRLGKLITQQLVRSELGEVALKRAWWDPSRIPHQSWATYQRMLAVKHQMEALVEIAQASAAAAAAPNTSAQKQPAQAQSGTTTMHDGSLAAQFHELAPRDGLPHGIPVCILHGVQDKLVDLSESQRAYREMRAQGVPVTLVKVEHCGHVPAEEYPALFLQHLFVFMSEVENAIADTYGGASQTSEQQPQLVRGGHVLTTDALASLRTTAPPSIPSSYNPPPLVTSHSQSSHLLTTHHEDDSEDEDVREL